MSARGFTIEGLARAYDDGADPPDVVAEAYDRIEACADPAVWITLRPRDEVVAEARALARTQPRPPLWGVPFAVKDNIDAAGLPTTCACPPFAYRPEGDAAVIARLRAAGALVVGKTNLDQFATGLVGVRSPHGIPRCVFDARYVSGGSSSGSAVAVARGLVAFALGTDTAGSGRVPAAFNGVVGVKPTRGLLSTSGVVPASRSLDCVSVFAASAAEGDLVRRVAQAFDPDDPYSRRASVRALRGTADAGVAGVLREEDREFFGDDAAAELYARAVERAAAAGYAVQPIDWAPFREAAGLLYGGAWVAERLAALERALALHAEAVDPAVRTILEDARRHSGADAFRARDALAVLARRADAVWGAVDFLLLPTAPTIYRIDAVLADPLRLNANLGTYTNFVNLLDCCAVAVPAGFTGSGLPFGVTVVAPAFCDDALAAVADRLHRVLEPTFGVHREAVPAAHPPGPPAGATVDLAVVGAHLSGEPLNHALVERGGQLVARTRTAADYRLYALAGTTPPKPGLVREPGFAGPGVEAEVWRVSIENFGRIVAEVPPPLAIGGVTLASGETVRGFLCEAWAAVGNEDITVHGGWKAYSRATRGC
ncbi:MAG: allophanate hydrolase [Thermodesulfobacteriota bacterium]